MDWNPPTNKDRARWASIAVGAFQGVTKTDDEDALADLLTDLMHYADGTGQSFADALKRADYNYQAELDKEDRF